MICTDPHSAHPGCADFFTLERYKLNGHNTTRPMYTSKVPQGTGVGGIGIKDLFVCCFCHGEDVYFCFVLYVIFTSLVVCTSRALLAMWWVGRRLVWVDDTLFHPLSMACIHGVETCLVECVWVVDPINPVTMAPMLAKLSGKLRGI